MLVGPLHQAHPRPGDLARIDENVTPTSSQRKFPVSKGKKANSTNKDKPSGLEGVVYKVTLDMFLNLDVSDIEQVSDTRIVIAIDSSDSSATDDIDLPERCRVLKLANSVTYDRYLLV